MDLHTFGKTPAAIYLAFQLTQHGDKRLAQRVGHSLSYFREMTAALERANQFGILSQHQVSSLGNLMRVVTDEQYEKFKPSHELIANLVRNIMVGELKSLLRRGKQVKDKNKEIQRRTAGLPKEIIHRVSGLVLSLSDVDETITPDTLMQKSLKKLERRGKISTLY